MPIYNYKGQYYNIPEEQVQSFEKDLPEAKKVDDTPFYLVDTNKYKESNIQPEQQPEQIQTKQQPLIQENTLFPENQKLEFSGLELPENKGVSLPKGKPLTETIGEGMKQLETISKVKSGIKEQVENKLQETQQKLSTIEKFEPSPFVEQQGEGIQPLSFKKPEDYKTYTNYSFAQDLLKDTQKIIDATKEKGLVKSTFKGFTDMVLDPDSWDLNIHNARQKKAIEKAVKKADKGEPLTDDEQELLDAAALNMATQQFYSSDIPRTYRWGQIAGQSAPFMVEMLLNPISGAGKGIAKSIAKYGIKRFGAKGAAKTALKAGARTVGDILAGLGMTVTSGAPKVAEDIAQQGIGNIDFKMDEKGDIVYGGHEGASDKSVVGKALQAIGSNAIEYQSEMLGASGLGKLLGKAAPVNKLLEATKATGFGKFVGKLNNSEFFKNLKGLEARAQWSGILGEYGEEVYGTLAHAAMGEEDIKTLTDVDKQVDTFMGLALTGGALSGINTVGYAVDVATTNSKLKELEQQAQNRFENWDEISETLKNTSVDERTKLLKEAISKPDLSPESKVILTDYLSTLTYKESLHGAREEVRKQDREKAAGNGIMLYEKAKEKDIDLSKLYNDKRELEEKLGDFKDVPLEEIEELPDASPDIIEAARKYDVVKNEFDTMMDSLKKDVDEYVDRQTGLINTITRDDGYIIEADLGDRRGESDMWYVVDGNIAFNDDGTIDKEKSDDVVVVSDTEGKKKQVSIDHIANVNVNRAEDVVETIKNEAYKTFIDPFGEKLEGEKHFNPGEKVEYIDNKEETVAGTVIDKQNNTVTILSNDGKKTQTYTEKDLEPRLVGNMLGDIRVRDEIPVKIGDMQLTAYVQGISDNKAELYIPDAPDPAQRYMDLTLEEINKIRVKPQAEQVQAQAETIKKSEKEGESVSPDKIQQNVRETAETVAESQITPEQQAEAEKQQFMQSLPIVEKGKNKGQIDQSRMTPEQNIKYFEYQYGKEKAVEAARKMADNLKARIKKEQAKLDADPFNIAQNELVDSLTKQQKAYQDYAFEAMQEKTEKNIEELPKSSVLEERKKRKEEIQEEEASKTGTVSQSIKEKWDAAEKIEGIEDVITLANGEKIPGRYVLTTADVPSPSHDVDRNFAKTKGFPVNEQGKTVNDRDYEADEHAQLLVQQRANKYDERAIQTPVVVSKDGIVLSGNDRTMAGKIAARNGTDKAYVDYITKYADRWGFTPQMIKSFDHPRIVFVPDVELPYNTATFAKFNAEEKKTQSSLESAIKASKSLSKDVIIPLANIIDEFEKLNDFYANKQATKTAIQMLLQNNVIQPNEIPRLMDGELLSTEGKSFLETVMLASVLKEQALREIDTMRSVRQSLMRIMPQLISNAALRDYTLTSELNNAIHLLYEAKQTGSKVKLQLMQGSIFDAPASQIYKETEKLLAIMLENTKDTGIRAIFESYNKEASAVESGQIDMFEGILSKPDLLSLILNKYGQQTESTRQDEPAAKGDGKGEGDRSGRGESEREGQQPGEQSTGKGTKQQEIKEPNDYIRRTVDKWVDLYEKGEYEEIFDDDIFNNVYANKHIIKPFEERIGITIPDISTEKAKKDFIKSLKEKFVKPETDSLKRNQYEIIRQSNPIRDDIHTGIRSEADILTAEEAFTPSIDENEDVTPDFTVSDMKEALKSGLITVHSSYPIENGVFVTPSKMEAQNYAGKNKVYSKTVPLSNVAWIDAIEGQYAEIERQEEKKEPWQMTRKEFESTDDYKEEVIGGEKKGFDFTEINNDLNDKWVYTRDGGKGLRRFVSHKKIVQKALSEGKPVPAEVLKDYPDLEAEKGSDVITPTNSYDVKGNKILTADEWNSLSKEEQEEFGDTITKSITDLEGNTFNVDYNIADPLQKIINAGFATGQSDSGTLSDHPGYRYVEDDKLGRYKKGEPINNTGAYLTFWKPEATKIAETGRKINTQEQIDYIRNVAKKLGFEVLDTKIFNQPSISLSLPYTNNGKGRQEILKEAGKLTDEKYPGLKETNFLEWIEKRNEEFEPIVVQKNGGVKKWTDQEIINKWNELAEELEKFKGIVSKDEGKSVDNYNEQIKQLRQEIDDLIRERDEKFPNPDIESPMSKEEKELNKRIADKFSKINRIIKNKRDEQRARNTAAIELETEAIESASKAVEYKSKNVGSDQQSAGEVKEETDELIGKVEEQLQKIDLRLQNLRMTGKRYSTEGIARDYPVSILSKGIIKKDATKFVDAIKKLTGLQYDTNKKGKTEKVSVNIAPAGGDISFFLWSNVDPELGVYVSIPVESFENTEYDEYFVPKEGNILWRLTAKKNKYTGFKNRWVNADITAGELSKILLDELNKKLKENGKTREKSETATSDKVNEKTKITSPEKKKAGDSGQKQLLDIKPGKPEPQPFDIVQKAKEVVKKDQERRSPEKKKKTLSDYPLANKFITDWQKPAVRDMWESHESIVENIEKTLESMPRKPQDNGMKSTVYAHYFMGATDIFVMDVEGDNIYAYVILNGDSQMSEAGTMSLSYITGIMGMELDFFWTPKPLDEALYNADREYFPNPKEVKKEISGEKTTEIKEKPLSLTENKSEEEPEKEEQHERERTKEQDGRRDNSRAESDRRGLPDSEQVGEQRTPAEDTRRDSQSRRGDIDVSGSQSGAGFKYDLSKSYSNEEIHQIVSSVTDIVDGKVVITGEVTDDIKTIAERYIPGGIAKQGRGVLDEYYTDTKIVDTVRDILSKYFNQNKSIRVLEPSVGVGNFIQAVPTNESEIVAFEINETTARIAKIFHPDIEVNVRSFETEFIDESGKKKPMPEKYDLVIGNPPYGEHRGIYKGLGEERNIAKYEDYFVKRSLDVLKENGMLAMVLPSGWMNRHKKEDGYRIEVAYRLPEGAFEATKIGTDIVVLKKDSDYHSTEEHNYFGKHPENILGEVKERKNRFGRTEEYVEGDIDTAIEQIKKNEAKRIAEELDIEPTTDNIEDIEGAIEETADETGAKNIAKATRPKKSTPSKPHKGGKIKITPDKLKYELNKNDEVIPAVQLFDNKFSEEEAEAFKDCDYQGKFKNPEKHKKHANYYKGDWVHDFYYAEGNIYEKLEQLEVDKPNMSAEQYEKQKKMLKDVLPEQKTIDNISISPNTVFVKNLIITTDRAIAGKETLKNLFFQFLSNLPSEAFGDSNVWEVRDYINNNQVYGSDKYRNRLVRERRKKAANDLFYKFIKEELTEAERKQIEYAFNREYNAVYRPDYSKVPMFSSINKNFKGKPLVLMEVQKAGIGRMTVKGVGLLAHEVGFGKTLSGVLAMHEAMTRGFVKKPIVIVPNDSILKQWVETIYESIPNATVNILGNLGVKYDLSDFSINDGEITIVTYSGFKTMGFNDNTYEELASEFEYITDELKSHKSNRDKEKEKAKKAETKGKMKRGASYNFENFGFDYMIFDEVHNANHIVGKVKLDKKEASDFRSQTQRTSDLGIKTWIASQYIQKKNNGRNVCLLSATPFTNKPLEYYSILSLIANSTLKRMGFYRIDQFFETFMEAENDIEIKADGSTVDKTSVRRFKNNGLFNQLLSEFIDIKGEEDNPDLVRPNRHNKEYKIAQNSLTEQTLDAAQELLSDNDTVLSGITQARLAAFSPYASYLCPEKPATHKEFVENSPKIYATVKLIEQNIKDNNEAGQLIYSEIGIEFFPMIRDYLVKESGLKEDEVVIITGATSNKERARIQEAFNKGDVKIIIGSPAIKEGMNLQENTTDMYILSLPYNFTQLRQVEGRGWRQGNKWENIRINYMLTNDTVDVFMLQRLQVKQNLYNEAMRSGAESVDVGDINTEELKTALITNPFTRAQIEVMIERKRLEDEKTKITADLAFILRKFEKYNELKKDLEYQKESIKKYEEWGKKDEWYRKAADRLKEKLQSYVENLKEEQQKLAEKGVNVDNIKNQEKRASEQIKEIDKKIENLKEVQDLLVEKYIKENEEKARKKGETIDKFVSERAKENKTFYEKRKESDSVFLQGDLAKTYGSDKKVRMRAADRSETQTGGTASVFDELKLRETQNRFDNPLNDTDKYYAAVELMEIAEKILNTGLRTVVVKGKREVAQVLRNYGLKEEDADFYDNYEDPIQGVYYKGVVILNSSDINTSGELFDTWIHEIMHDYIGKNKGELIPLLGNVPDEVFEEVLPESYAGLSDLDKLEELLSFLSERVVSGEELPDYDIVEKEIKPIIYNFLNEITNGRYQNNQNLQRGRRALETSYEDIEEGLRETARTVGERAEAGKSGKNDTAGRYGREGISAEREIERLRSVPDPDKLVANADNLRKAIPNYGKFLNEVLNGMPDKERFIQRVKETGFGNMDKAIERYMAEVTDPEELERIMDLLGTNMSFNTLRYILWRNANPNDGTKEWKIEDARKRREFNDNNLFKKGEPPTRLAENEYEKRIRSRFNKGFKGLMYGIEEGYFDKMASLKYLQEAISGGKEIPEKENAYMLENQLSSRNTAEIAYYNKYKIEPMNKAAVKIFGNDLDAIDTYLIAKHGLERNDKMARREAEKYLAKKLEENIGKEEFNEDEIKQAAEELYEKLAAEKDYSGLTALAEERGRGETFIEAAQNIVEEVESAHSAEDINALWNAINDATKWILEKQFEAGMMSKETYENIRDMYTYYVPLRGFSETVADDLYEYIEHQLGDFNSVLKKAYGRTSRAYSPFAEIINMAESGILQANRNKMKQAFYRLVVKNPSNYATIKDVWYVMQGDEWVEKFPDIPSDADSKTVSEIVDNFEKEMEKLKQDGLAKKGRRGLDIGVKIGKAQASEHAVRVWVNGEEKVIYINGNPRAAQAINGLTRDMVKYDIPLVRAVQSFNRQMASNFTSRNPVFTVTNFMGDIQLAIMSSAIKEGGKYSLQLAQNAIKVIPTISKNLWGKGGGEFGKYWEEFLYNGGETGYANLRNIENITKELQKSMNKLQGRHDMWNPLHIYIDTVSRANRMIEDISRFATYVTSRQMGRSIERSVSDAKEITINFNRKGSGIFGADILHTFYLFANPALQSMRLLGLLAKKYPTRFTAVVSLHMAMGFMMPMLNQMLLELVGDDDDKEKYWNINEWIRRNHVVIYLPWTEEKFFTFKLSHEFRPFYGMGEILYAVASKNLRHENIFQEMVAQFSSILPIDPFTGSVNWWIPDFVKPVYEANVSNINFMGRPIFRDTDWNKLDPDWTKAYKSTPTILVEGAKWINEATGGDDVVKGKIDINPAKLNHIFTGYMGGFLGTYVDIGNVVFNMLTGESVTENQIPVVNKIIRSSDELTEELRINGEYFYYLDWMKDFEHKEKGYRARLADKQYVTKYRKLFEGDETRIYFYAKEMTRKIKTLEEIDKEKAMKLKREFISRMHEFEDETN